MQTGFVGLGAMGAHMARSLHRASLWTGVWNRTPDKAAALAAELRCIAFSSVAELAGQRIGGQDQVVMIRGRSPATRCCSSSPAGRAEVTSA